jgi:LysR family transcriptional regulator, glycine cleavage system transcriptional activator
MLRVFEAAARTGSFVAAANELAVTHSAVSHQIRALEDQLGFTVFLREGRGVQLTPLGQELAREVNAAMGGMGRTLALLRQRANPLRLTVTTMPSFAACWLAPRIGGFLDAFPDIELNIVSTATVLDFARDGVDVAVRFGYGDYPGQQAELLMRDEMLVVASPILLAGGTLASPQALGEWPLLRSDGEFWHAWFKRAGLEWPEPRGGLYINDSALVLESAIAGRGIALARRTLCQSALDDGRLQQVFPLTLPNSRAYWFVTPEGAAVSPLTQHFHDWIYAEAGRFPTISTADPIDDIGLERQSPLVRGLHGIG